MWELMREKSRTSSLAKCMLNSIWSKMKNRDIHSTTTAWEFFCFLCKNTFIGNDMQDLLAVELERSLQFHINKLCCFLKPHMPPGFIFYETLRNFSKITTLLHALYLIEISLCIAPCRTHWTSKDYRQESYLWRILLKLLRVFTRPLWWYTLTIKPP